MEDALWIDGEGRLRRGAGLVLDPWRWCWQPAGAAVAPAGAGVTPRAAIAHLGRGGAMRHLPVGVIGPRNATSEQAATAEALGAALGGLGLVVVCGGRGGVMAAVARGARAAGGLTVGILPGPDWREANPDIALPIATGLGEARNAVIARAAVALISVGHSLGTLTEVGFGLHFGRPVIGLCDTRPLEGLVMAGSVDAAVDLLCGALLDLAGCHKTDSDTG
ncbi:MAG: hypothetical protein KatS3mg118_1179 [Paracoccaceae bacterium]|nr:MAG: hypothetical protein KatS3mg118_1179 [Paracoccaceae bacterium]